LHFTLSLVQSWVGELLRQTLKPEQVFVGLESQSVVGGDYISHKVPEASESTCFKGFGCLNSEFGVGGKPFSKISEGAVAFLQILSAKILDILGAGAIACT